jgi:anti-sigma factor RsiW
VKCAESLRVQAAFDGELDAVSAAEVERHAGHCAECRSLLEDLERTRGAIRRELPYERAPAELRGRIARLLEREAAAATPGAARSRRRTRPYWIGALGGAAVTAAAATALLLFLPSPPAALLDELLAAHQRSLMPSHLTDVLSSDRHTVKPWFAGHADVSPVVADFSARGYRLIGGRADYFEHQRVAVTVYQHGEHLINVFAWAGGRRAPAAAVRDGYHIACWRSGNLQYCAVSDTGRDELDALVRMLEE